MRSALFLVVSAVTVTGVLAVGCDDVADPSVDTSFDLPEGDIEPDLPLATDPRTTATPNPAEGGPGQAPAPGESAP